MLRFNREAALEEITARVASGVDHGVEQILRAAIKKAPERARRTARPRSTEEAVRAIHEDFVPDRTRQAARFGSERPASNIRTFRRARAQGLGTKEAAKAARTKRKIGTFRFAFFDSAGNQHTHIAAPGGKLVAAAATRGGNLKSKIRRTDVEVDGSRVEARVISGAPYSKYPEFGFTHVGGVRVPARPFFRPAIADWVGNWRSSFGGGR